MSNYDDLIDQMDRDQKAIGTKPNKYDNLIDSMTQAAENRKAQAALAVGYSSDKSTDRAALNRSLAKRYNTSPEVVDAYPEEFRQRMAIEVARENLKNAPKLSDHITSDPSSAEVLHDDVHNASALEQTMSAWKPSLGEKLVSWWRNDLFGMNKRETARAMNTYAAQKAGMSEEEARTAVAGINEAYPQAISKFSHLATFGIIPDVAGDARTFSGQIGAGLGAGAGFFIPGSIVGHGVQSLGIKSLEVAAEDSVAKAVLKTAVRDALTIGATSTLVHTGGIIDSPDLLTAAGKAGNEFVSGAKMGAAYGTVGGVAGKVMQGNTILPTVGRMVANMVAADAASGTTPISTITGWDHLSDQEKGDKVAGYVMDALFGIKAPHKVNGGWFKDAAKADNATQNYQLLNNMNTLAGASQWRGRDADGFKRFVNSVSEDGNLKAVYVDGKVFAQALNEANVTYDQLKETMPDVAKQMKAGLETQGAVRIETGDYLTHVAGGPVGEKILDHLKDDPEGFTYGEAKEWYQNQLHELVKAASAKGEEQVNDPAFKESLGKVYDQILADHERMNRHSTDVNKINAKVQAKLIGEIARRQGITPEEAYRQHFGALVSEGAGGFNQFAGTNARSADMYELVRAKEMLAKGRNRDTVRRETGWHQGPDGHWRFEITDDNATWKKKERALAADAEKQYGESVKVDKTDDGLHNAHTWVNGDYVGAFGATPEAAKADLYEKIARRLSRDAFNIDTVDHEDFADFIKRRSEEHFGKDADLSSEELHPEFVNFYDTEADAYRLRNTRLRLGDILDHPKLFAAYPDLADVRVDFTPTNEHYGSFDPNTGDIELSTVTGVKLGGLADRRTSDEMLSTLLHEIQHAIQEREGFTGGGNTNESFITNVRHTIDTLSATTKEALNQWKWRNSDKLDAKEKAAEEARYVLMWESALSLRRYALADKPSGLLRLIRNNMQWFYDERFRSNEAARDLQRDFYAIPKRHKMYERNEFLRNMAQRGSELLLQEIPEELRASFGEDPRTVKSVVKAFQREVEKREKDLAEYRQLEQDARGAQTLHEAYRHADAFVIYKALHGEIEARNTQARQKLTEEERRNTPLERTADFPREHAIIHVGGADIKVPMKALANSSENFDQWFGKSKVVDANGKPLTVYHGSPEAFETFMHEFIGANGTTEGMGFYFTDKKDIASGYSEGSNNLYDSHLRIEKPLDDTKLTLTRAEVGKFIKALDPDGQGVLSNYGDVSYEGYDKVLRQALDLNFESSDNDVDLIHGLIYGSGVSTKDFLRTLTETTGHDGIIVDKPEWGGNQKLYIAFQPEQIKSASRNNGEYGRDNPNMFEQGEGANRGFYNPDTKTIGLLKNADLSTFIHETGHWIFDTYTKIATSAEGSAEIKADTAKLLKWVGVESLEKWNAMSLEEQRPYHEQMARGFEKYFAEGKAPSLELQPVFSRVKTWFKRIYENLTNLNVELSDEVRGVFDRMLASEQEIQEAEAARGFYNIFEAKPEGMTDEAWQEYTALGQLATGEAIDDMESRSLRDMKWLSGAKSRALRAVQKEAEALRREARIDARRQVLQEPVYQAWQFLTARDEQKAGKPAAQKQSKLVDPSRDSFILAIAKLGGLKFDKASAEYGIGETERKAANKASPVGKPLFRTEGGKDLDSMAEALVEQGYLSVDEHGKHDLHEFEEKLMDGLSGVDHYAYGHERENEFGLTAEDLKDLPAGRLDREQVAGLTGEETAAKLDELKMTRKDALDPDIVADMFGFGSGREMIEALAKAEHPKFVIEGLTDRIMLERHGEVATPEARERAAEEAIHNEARAKFVATGLKILTKSPVSSRLLLKGAKEAAEAAIGEKAIKEVNPRQYTAAEAKNNKDVLKYVAKDPNGAVMAQRASLLNNQLVVAAQKALKDVDKGLEYFKKLSKDSVRGNIDVAFRDQIDALLGRYDLRSSLTPEQANERNMLSLERFAEKLAAMGFNVDIPEHMILDANRMHYKDMTVADFRGLVDAVKSLEKLGREVQKITDGDIQRDLNEVALEAKEQLEKLPQKQTETNRGLSLISKKWIDAKHNVRSVFASLLKIEQICDWADQYNSNGIFNRLVFRKIADAEGARNDLDMRISKAWAEAIAKLPKDLLKNNRGSVEMPGVIDGLTGENQRLTWQEKIALAGIRGDATHFSKLLKGEQWDAEAVLDFLDKNMSKEEWDFVSALAGTFQELAPLKAEMMRDLGASAPKLVDHIPFATPHGEMSGWYWPITYDPARSRTVKERNAKHEASLFEDNIYSRADTSTGREITRNENYAKPMLLSIDVLPRVLKDEIRDITTRKAIIEVDRFMSHPEVRRSFIKALSEEHYDLFNGWLLSLANDAMVKPSELRGWDRLFNGIRTRTTIVGLGFRFTTMVMHGLTAAGESVAEAGPKAMMKGIFNKKTMAALTTIGPEFMQRGLDSFYRDTNFAANRDFIFERSAEMRHRSNEIERDVREKLREIELELMNPATGKIQRAKLAVMSRAYSGIAMLDMASALPTWMGAYIKGMTPKEKGGLGMSEDDAIYFADKTLRNAHGGGGIKDLAAVQRGGEAMKLFTMFYTFWNHNLNRIADTAKRVKELPQTYADAKESGNWAGFRGDVGMLMMRSFMYTLGVQYIHHMLNPPKEEEGEEGWLKWLGKTMASAAGGGIPLVRDVVGHYAGGKDYEMSPVAGLIHNTDRLLHDADSDSDAKRFVKHAMTEAGYIFGLPLGQPASTTQFLWDVWNGEQHPETVAEWWRGVSTGDMNPR